MHAYFISKFLILNDYFTYYAERAEAAQLKAAIAHAKAVVPRDVFQRMSSEQFLARYKGRSAFGTLDLDLDYLTTLLEQDSVANLRYGILFLLALSSLGVYSIILAG